MEIFKKLVGHEHGAILKKKHTLKYSKNKMANDTDTVIAKGHMIQNGSEPTTMRSRRGGRRRLLL